MLDRNEPDVATLKARQEIAYLARPKQPERKKFSVSRWPYTYGCDQYRLRTSAASRAEASGEIRSLADKAGLPHTFVFEMLATAYCLENNIQLPASL